MENSSGGILGVVHKVSYYHFMKGDLISCTFENSKSENYFQAGVKYCLKDSKIMYARNYNCSALYC